MTLKELFTYIGQNPDFILFYFLIIPLTALITGILGKGEGHLNPWKYLYAFLIYFVSIPGIFAVAINIYFFLFQRGDVMQTDVYMQILPILVLLLTIWLIRRNVDLNLIPGFKTLSGLWLMMFASMTLMFLLDKTRIYVFSYLPFQYLLFIFLALFAVIYLGWRKFSAKSS
jgi:hypothetical protein